MATTPSCQNVPRTIASTLNGHVRDDSPVSKNFLQEESPFSPQPPRQHQQHASYPLFHCSAELKHRHMLLFVGDTFSLSTHPTVPSTAQLSPTFAVTSKSPANRHAVTVVPSCLPPSSSASFRISASVEANAARRSPSSRSGGSPRRPVLGAALATYVWSWTAVLAMRVHARG